MTDIEQGEPGKPCATLGCPHLVPIGAGVAHCLVHRDADKRARRVRYDELDARRGRGTTTERGYGARWRKVREVKLQRDPICEACLEDNPTGVGARGAQVVDHIKPISEGGALYAVDNLRSLCRPCHAAKTASDVQRRRETASRPGPGGGGGAVSRLRAE